MSAILSARGLVKNFGGIQAVDRADLEVIQGSITGLIGPNGAGKTTFFNLLSNFIPPDSGEVYFGNDRIDKLPPHRIARKGMVRTFQVARALSRLSVLENLLLATPGQSGEQVWNVFCQPRRIKLEEQTSHDRAMEILTSIGLVEKANDYAGGLSGGQRKLLEIGRVMMTKPRLILLDEPAAGVNPTLINQICEYIQYWNRQGISFLIIEHNMDVIMGLCDRVWVLAEGRNLAVGKPEEIQRNSQVLEAYLGTVKTV